MYTKPLADNCSECDLGLHHFCPKRNFQGFNQLYGGFSEYTMTDPEATVKIPDALSFEE
jgi:D-arabinose 1-dehydrogenase-like Zn-dependent alcohol dehydrogenase